jgi:hypothetical protein
VTRGVGEVSPKEIGRSFAHDWWRRRSRVEKVLLVLLLLGRIRIRIRVIITRVVMLSSDQLVLRWLLVVVRKIGFSHWLLLLTTNRAEEQEQK